MNTCLKEDISVACRKLFWLHLKAFNTGRGNTPRYKHTLGRRRWYSPLVCTVPNTGSCRLRKQWPSNGASAAVHLDGSMPRRAWTARARSLLLTALILFIILLQIWLQFWMPEHAQKLTKFGIVVTSGKNCDPALSLGEVATCGLCSAP